MSQPQAAARILVVEDEKEIAGYLRRGLAFEGFTVEVAHDGPTGIAAARERPADLVILDIMLPGMDGFEVCRRLRAGSDVPIIMLTAKETVPDRVMGLESGADDYLIKPFAFEELLARIRALLRRHVARTEGPVVLQVNGLEMNTASREVTIAGRAVQLTAKEYELLELFMRHPGQVLTRDVIYDRVWGYDFGGESNIIEVYVRYLRQKLEESGEGRMLHTVRGAGYILREQPYGER
ncbi:MULTISPECIES: response regulator transcription factor [Herpetosiphon]|uniref:Transcriptional regulator n=3 Tax=Herpetosiphon TaxID=64 RepID=A0A0P6YGA6_9CHLR|nr:MULTISPECIES: response regulator transcription factor [Herpetosiphon]ABX05437.1 two component transcriptional regulator, winged helix family [Herpetosiphon aurantiacus DSM 785]MCA0353058.1 response regulator transcription factor [Chloroflexota bacterium]KPL91235.1 transcriptional regulator [Herpetosiphon geysericola]MBM7843014.1 DNA-binding response OmpR family regulator [Herpetosiphon giganteus]HBW48921.1 DNA-binding response regulator [Herpetosiphon sp.]